MQSPSPGTAPSPRVRARDLGIAVGIYPPGPANAITDVTGVLVGHSTIVRGSGALKVGEGPVRTGVTAVLPRKDVWFNAVFAATHTLNGDGEMTGVHWIRDLETLAHPVLITNTASVGAVHDAAIAYMNVRHPNRSWGFLPVVAETWDGRLNDIRGRHVREEHVFAALDGAKGGAVAEGNVGGGTGMVCYSFKGGIGTSSRHLPSEAGGYTVGVLVQANFGRRDQLVVDGVPVGREIPDLRATVAARDGVGAEAREGSVIVVIATDAPLSSRQLERMARRASLGLARTGSVSGNSSGDIFVAFSTGNVIPLEKPPRTLQVSLLSTDNVEPLFRAVVETTEEAVLNALTAAETMTGVNGNTVYGLPYDRLAQAMAKYGRPIKVPGR
ncbi:MAG: P1 family peptidase [Acidobacteria bacterium]|nr:P1 family peptidase [Acidobacteriota bacterium]MBI3261617.1 P1 family peptidase [Acidobacteriota bacterium]